MTKILLVGRDEALLEGLVQSLAALGHSVSVALSLGEARELAAREQPLVAVLDRSFTDSSTEALGISTSPGGALVLYRTGTTPSSPLPPALQRSVLADLALPLERNRLAALVQHVEERAKATGRADRRTPPQSLPMR